ncbi:MULTISPECIES: PLP-dependent aminotransferase family protein [unclassified Pseudomonas]|uniref:aminotransferase-like domain-containing protein n=1 Tax=unclassified Pseudomonas TaxID=196821 RepID=UPI0021C6156B|nr:MULTISPECIES: PLP-dependent aminotransferase family protein [unclassified Pseudomonas]MCU1733676.1 PLP-dependent aminotransferase family protein [Pseudomonas sp. 20P_3.2_Bac4]MCU1744649.1 PLP-dependent aminotransferase family protein [Pseudomonas sp. 20P_3.2_Bac5]
MWIPSLPDDGQPRYLALVAAIARAIESGELQVGARLPPQRRLAWALGLNPSTTQQAYREAAARHLVSGEVGRGTYVLAGSKEATLFRLKQRDNGSSQIDLSTNVPVVDTDSEDFDRTLRELLQQNPSHTLEHYLGAEQLLLGRVHGASWLSQRGLHLTAAQVLLCGGAQQGLFSVLLSFCQPGEAVMVEALTAPGIKAACRQLRLPLHGVAMDHEGILPDDLDRVARASGARVLVLTPALHNPTGACMGEQRRRDIAAVVERLDLLLVEDDVYGALGDQPPLLPLLGPRGLLVSSLSKTVCAGLRLGWIVGDAALLERIDPYSQATHWPIAPLVLQIACRWIEDGTAARKLAWQREEVNQRWRLATRLLGPAMALQATPSPHVWVSGPRPGEVLAAACRAKGVEVVPAQVFAVKQGQVPAIRVSLTAARSRAELKQALERVAQVLDEFAAQDPE